MIINPKTVYLNKYALNLTAIFVSIADVHTIVSNMNNIVRWTGLNKGGMSVIAIFKNMMI